MAAEPDPDDRGEWIDLSTPEGNARYDELLAAEDREPMPLHAYAEHRAKRRAEVESAPAGA